MPCARCPLLADTSVESFILGRVRKISSENLCAGEMNVNQGDAFTLKPKDCSIIFSCLAGGTPFVQPHL